MIIYFVYVIQSEINKCLYIGSTDDIERRLLEHNSGKTRSTKPFVPYRLIYSEVYENKKEAIQRERQIKRSGKVRKELKEGTYPGPIV